MSSRLTDVLGYPACSLLGESLFNLIHTADIQNVQAAFLKRECLAKKSESLASKSHSISVHKLKVKSLS